MVESAISSKLTTQTQFLIDLQEQVALDPSPEQAVPRFLAGIQQLVGADTVRLVSGAGAYGVGDSQAASVDRDLWAYVAEHGAVQLAGVQQLPGVDDRTLMPNNLNQIVAEGLHVRGTLRGVLWMGFAEETSLDADQRALARMLGLQAVTLIATANNLIDTDRLRLLSILDSMMDAVILLDRQFMIQVLNPAAERLLDTSSEQAAGQPISTFIKHHGVLEKLGTVDGVPTRMSMDIGNQNFQAMVYDIDDDYHLIMLTDISHYKRLNENMTMFLQTVSHDLRSPLTAAKGFVDMLPMVGELNDKQTNMRERILTSIVDMTNLVEKVLDAGRLDPQMGAYEIRRDTTDPVKVVEKVVSNLHAAAQKKNLTLQAETMPNVPLMNLDELMLERSLVNLVENAVKYTPSGGHVVVSARVDKSNLVLAVQDDGLGIPAEKIDTLFERGSRIRREEHKQIRGSGLGLFIVKNVAQQHGGEAVVESVEGEGSTFKITIPISGANMIGAAEADE